MKTGIIRITDKVIFEYYELEKPKPGDYCIPRNDCTFRFYKKRYKKALKAYEASKRSVAVENVLWGKYTKVWRWSNIHNLDEIKNNQKCKAEITVDTCNIIELL